MPESVFKQNRDSENLLEEVNRAFLSMHSYSKLLVPRPETEGAGPFCALSLLSILSRVLAVHCCGVLAMGRFYQMKSETPLSTLCMPSGDTVVPGLVAPARTSAISSSTL